ncbi:MAG: GDP-mannose 4,6-dehydratase [Thermoplasmata archaeon]|nr:GDP-mannose 4,6-dehydratase [Thermoplasmata archaeon]
MKKVMVTGGAGFIGSNLVDVLIDRGYQVIVLDDLSTGNISNISKHLNSDQLTFIEKDINDISLAELQDVNAVFHLAARVNVVASIADPLEDARVNYYGTLNVLERCREAGIKKVLFTSSAAVYGDVGEVPTTENADKYPLSPYGNHKFASGNLLRMYNEIHGMKNVVFRLFNVYGPRQDPSNPYSGVISKFMEWATKDRDLTIFGDGNQTRDFVYVKDVARSLLMAYEKDISGTFNVGTGSEISLNDLAGTIVDVTGSKSKIVHREKRAGEIYRSCCVNDKLKSSSGWAPDTSMKEGLSRYWDTLV